MNKVRVPFSAYLKSFITSATILSSVATLEAATPDKWTDLEEDENYTARHECSFVHAGDRFIMFGGRENAQTLDTYDFSNNSWSRAASAPKEFNHFQATFHKGIIWVIGSFKTNSFPREIPEENIWLYHISTNQWIKGPSIPEHRRRGGAGLVVYQDKFYLVGGNTIGHDGGYVNWFDEYDPKKNTWTELENASQQRDHFSAAIIDDRLYAVGGRKSGGEGGVFAPLIDVVDVFDFSTHSWTTLKDNLPTPRAAPGVAVLHDELYVMGGEGTKKGPAYKLVEAYSPYSDAWSRKADMHFPRHGTQAIVSGNGIYIAAGSPNRGGGRQHNMEVYGEDSATGTQPTTSHFESIAEQSIPIGKSTRISVKNSGGNSASFISSVAIEGKNKHNFLIKNDLDLRLIDANDRFDLNIEYIGKKSGETATIRITYNGTMESVIKISSSD